MLQIRFKVKRQLEYSMMNYKRYFDSLADTPEPEDISNPVAIDYKGLVKSASNKGVEPCDLSKTEQEMFIISKNVAVG